MSELAGTKFKFYIIFDDNKNIFIVFICNKGF
ncbi:hypothetical protein FUAX_00650 [Fulvitalea axinellae]|uniref:Uncharacterized protein n=1 Tax=Fulvitalea axinellae TaxID=1182444 RepID=A0AAU9CD21_9BACT|nr:hypothetical protein FUAX_00650 [Fulvitalea axinellae]